MDRIPILKLGDVPTKATLAAAFKLALRKLGQSVSAQPAAPGNGAPARGGAVE